MQLKNLEMLLSEMILIQDQQILWIFWKKRWQCQFFCYSFCIYAHKRYGFVTWPVILKGRSWPVDVVIIFGRCIHFSHKVCFPNQFPEFGHTATDHHVLPGSLFKDKMPQGVEHVWLKVTIITGWWLSDMCNASDSNEHVMSETCLHVWKYAPM